MWQLSLPHQPTSSTHSPVSSPETAGCGMQPGGWGPTGNYLHLFGLVFRLLKISDVTLLRTLVHKVQVQLTHLPLWANMSSRPWRRQKPPHHPPPLWLGLWEWSPAGRGCPEQDPMVGGGCSNVTFNYRVTRSKRIKESKSQWRPSAQSDWKDS